MPTPLEPLPEEVLAALRQGQKIAAVKLLREATNLDLKTALEVIESHERGESHPAYPPRPGALPGAGAALPGAGAGALPGPVLEALRQGRKIEAIKLLREATGLGLKDAKDLVDAAGAAAGGSAGPDATQLPPPTGPRSLKGLWRVIALAVLAAAAYYWLQGRG